MKAILIVLIGFFQISTSVAQDMYVVSKAIVDFTSDAPFEMIEAESNKLTGILKISNRSFVFRVPIKSFEGFNSSLQKTHFNENYMESAKFPYAVFEGEIIEEINFNYPGTYTIRGKGSLTTHGVKQDRIINCDLVISTNKIKVNSKFTVLLEDHNIKIPSVLGQKIAKEIIIDIEIELILKKD